VVFTPQEPGPWSLLVSGLTIEDGYLLAQVLDDGNVVLEDIVATSTQGFAPVGVTFFQPASGTSSGSAEIRRCRVRVATAAGYGIRATSFPGTAMRLRIADNRVEPLGVEPAPAPPSAGPTGILVQTRGELPSSVEVVRNAIAAASGNDDPAARLASGIVIGTDSTSGAVALRVADNAVVLRESPTFFNAGVRVSLGGGAVDARVLNNTVVGGNTGVRIERYEPGATLAGRLDNNLVAYLATGVWIGDGLEAAFGNDYNGLWAIAQGNQFAPGAHTVTGLDPRLATLTRPRLRATSVMRNAGSVALRDAPGPGSLPPLEPLDADGLRRVKDAEIDIGAYEFGDQTLTWNTLGFSNVSTITDPTLLDQPLAKLQITRSGGSRPADTTPNPRPMSQRYGTYGWQLLADDGFNINVGAGFHVLFPGAGAGNGSHTTTAGSVSGPLSALGAPFGTLPPDTILLVSPTRGDDNGGVANPHPVAPSHQFGAWYVWNTDGAPMPVGTRFTLLAQRPSANAFVHTVDAGNQPAPTRTLLSHPLLDGNPCAAPHVGQRANGALNPHPVGVRYDTPLQRWYVRNEDGAVLPLGTELIVLVDATAAESACGDALFENGFEEAQ
jgi:hypothetical protein